MKQTLAKAVAASTLTLSLSGPAHANDDQLHVYIGVGAGQSELDKFSSITRGDIEEVADLVDPGTTIVSGSTRDDDKGTFKKAFMGVQINDYVAFEVSYVDLGEVSSKFSGSGLDSGANAFTGTAGAEFESSGYGASLIGTYPVSDNFKLFAKVGVFELESTLKGHLNTSLGLSGRASETENDRATAYGIGAAYRIIDENADLWLRLEWERFSDVEGPLGLESDVDAISASLLVQY